MDESAQKCPILWTVHKINLYLCETKEYKGKINKKSIAMIKRTGKVIEAGNPALYQKVINKDKIGLYLIYTEQVEEMPAAAPKGRRANDNAPTKRKTRQRQVLIVGRTLHNGTRLTAEERNENEQTLQIAKEIRRQREHELATEIDGHKLRSEVEVDFFAYCQEYLANYTKKDVRCINTAITRFSKFVKRNYPQYAKRLKPSQIDREMIARFVDYLNDPKVCKGEGARTTYARFKKIVLYAVDHGTFTADPSHGVTPPPRNNDGLRKEVLSLDELQQLARADRKGMNPDVCRAFLFCALYSGQRFCDVSELTFKGIDYSNQLLSFKQAKTKGRSSHSVVTIPLSKEALEFLGKPQPTKNDTNPRDQKVFNLPTADGCNQDLRDWVRRAGIDKHITWHCARHTFATNLVHAGADIETVKELMGHSSTKETEIYFHTFNTDKKRALAALPKLDLSGMNDNGEEE